MVDITVMAAASPGDCPWSMQYVVTAAAPMPEESIECSYFYTQMQHEGTNKVSSVGTWHIMSVTQQHKGASWLAACCCVKLRPAHLHKLIHGHLHVLQHDRASDRAGPLIPVACCSASAAAASHWHADRARLHA